MDNVITYGDVRLALAENNVRRMLNYHDHVSDFAVTEICTGKLRRQGCPSFLEFLDVRKDRYEWIFVAPNHCTVELNYRKVGMGDLGTMIAQFRTDYINADDIARACMYLINVKTEEIELMREGA